MIVPVLARLEAFRGCSGGIDCGGESEGFDDLHVEVKWIMCGQTSC